MPSPKKHKKIREPMSALNKVKLIENHEPLVDVRKACPGTRVSRRCVPYLRETVADMVNNAQTLLPSGYTFWVRTALRTIEMQRDGYLNFYRALETEHPDWSYATLRRRTNQYFAPVDEKAPPGHTTGGAVDVGLITPSGRPAELTRPYEFWEGAATFIEGLTPAARRNRMTLYEAMMGAGFSNCEDEFWHYSYGDAAWAVRTGVDTCCYGLIEPPGEWLERRPDLKHKLNLNRR